VEPHEKEVYFFFCRIPKSLTRSRISFLILRRASFLRRSSSAGGVLGRPIGPVACFRSASKRASCSSGMPNSRQAARMRERVYFGDFAKSMARRPAWGPVFGDQPSRA
jgi:hypothetical protein